MGRAFEYRKATKMKRWGHMARVFTKLGKEITIAARDGGPDPDSNPRLRTLIQQCKRENMPKDNIDRAIKKATDKSSEGYKEINYEGYGPHGVAIFVETATDNNMRTVANIRSYFTKHGGTLGTQGCLQFLFERKACFTVSAKEGVDLEELELELIDFGVEELGNDEEGNIIIYGDLISTHKCKSIWKTMDSTFNRVNLYVFLMILKSLATKKWRAYKNSSIRLRKMRTFKMCSPI